MGLDSDQLAIIVAATATVLHLQTMNQALNILLDDPDDDLILLDDSDSDDVSKRYKRVPPGCVDRGLLHFQK